VFPAIYVRRPAARFYVVGARPGQRVCRLAALPGVVVTGTVADVRPYLAHARFAVAPLRVARGVQNKVLEAMAMAKPVVVSPQALEGIRAEVGRELLLARDATEFSTLCLSLLEGVGAELGRAARARVLADYGWEANLGPLDRLLARGPQGAGEHPQGGPEAAQRCALTMKGNQA
jgi:glycosyltransferase involved in cell wall biosynthesis